MSKKPKPDKSIHQVGIVAIREGVSPKRGASFFELRYVDPATGLQVKRRVRGLGLEEVQEMARHLTKQAHQGRGHLPSLPKASTVEGAIIDAVRLSRANKESAVNLLSRGRIFVRWLADHYPKVRTFDQLRPLMVQAYILHCEQGEKLAWDSVRMRLVPLKAAWKLMAENYPELVRPLPKLKVAPKPRRDIQCLDAGELLALLDWLKERDPELYAMGALQGLCGLRMQEASSLRVQDIDLPAATVTITETTRHKPKNLDSFRTVPVCAEVAEALRRVMEQQRVVPVTGEIFPLVRLDALSRRWKGWLEKAAAALENPHYAQILARKLRAAFATLAQQLGASDRAVKAYMGHAPGDVLGNHYRRIGLDELRSVSSLMEGWRGGPQGAGAGKELGKIAAVEYAEG